MSFRYRWYLLMTLQLQHLPRYQLISVEMNRIIKLKSPILNGYSQNRWNENGILGITEMRNTHTNIQTYLNFLFQKQRGFIQKTLLRKKTSITILIYFQYLLVICKQQQCRRLTTISS